jgi:hypothetical protein
MARTVTVPSVMRDHKGGFVVILYGFATLSVTGEHRRQPYLRQILPTWLSPLF